MRPVLPITLVALLACGGGYLAPQPSSDPVMEIAHLTSMGSADATPRPVILEWEPTPAPTPTPRPWTPAPTAKASKPASSGSASSSKPAATAQVSGTVASGRTAKATATPRPATPAPKATTKPTAAPTSRPAPSYDKEDVKARIRSAWPGDKEKAVRVVGCETGGSYNPRMTSSNGMYLGLWQFHIDTWRRSGGSGDPRDHPPEEQTRVAWNLFQSEGWSPWPHCGQQ